MTTAIKVEGLSKKYVIGHQKQERYTALRDVLTHKMRGFGQRLRHPLSFNREEVDIEEFWALRDIDMKIEQGDRVGIIGRNGAGKSTLLKVLSRITEPTSGKIHINGRVASLLEVGTGFHSELSGRENIYLNGAILGMRRNEIKRKFDEIVDFSGVEKFLDTPVKRYSSGMYVRLAFAVAAHLEPEILVVDEVLAVGDAQFQKKCLGKMEDVGKEGRTVLFVSHNIGAINALCQKAIQLDHGEIVNMGDTSRVTEKFMSKSLYKRDKDFNIGFKVKDEIINHKHSEGLQIVRIELENTKSPDIGPRMGDPLKIIIHYKTTTDFMSPAFVVSTKDLYGTEISRFSSMPISGFLISTLYLDGVIELMIDRLPLVSGTYYLDIGFVRERSEWIFYLEEVVEFEVAVKDVYGSGFTLDRSRGIITMDHSWKHLKNG